ncbi:hypothetical protein GA0061102_1001355 [Rhizobium miluonense]|uniref:Uncharacterized protein n=1 Tax=Rhizobium miluonense TaxID=411945 RepID=A0A1C3U201_9HYPH|nr:hypothetical protein GA0061102_1001355 [Rhizobium miluonense]
MTCAQTRDLHEVARYLIGRREMAAMEEDSAGRCRVSAKGIAKWKFLLSSPISRQVPSYTSGEPNVFQRNSLVLK